MNSALLFMFKVGWNPIVSFSRLDLSTYLCELHNIICRSDYMFLQGYPLLFNYGQTCNKIISALCYYVFHLRNFMTQWKNKTMKVYHVLSKRSFNSLWHIGIIRSAHNYYLCLSFSTFRFIVIVFPMKSRSLCTMTNLRRGVFFVWGLSLLLAAPVLYTKVKNVININFC